MVYVSGSPGYVVDCPASSSMMQIRGGKTSSLLESHRVDPVVDVCFQGAGSTSQLSTAAFAEVQLDGDYVIRGIDFTPISSMSRPVNMAINARENSDGTATWYVAQADANSGAAWTKLPFAANPQLDTDVAGQFIRVMPNLPAEATAASGYGFGFQLYGCPVTGTSLISFQFKSSKQAIIQRFTTISSFLNQLSTFLCYINKFTTAPAACDRLVYADMTEGTTPNVLSGIGPATIPTIEITYRVLPPASNCVDCRSAATVQSQLASELATTTSKSSQILRALDTWIEDSDPFTCYNKVCGEGLLCVNGACVSPLDMQSISTADAELSVQMQSASQIDKTLQLSPLNVISDADQLSGILRFSSTPIDPGTMLAVSKRTGQVTAAVTTAPDSTSNDSFLQRYMIPIAVGGGFVVIVGSLLGYKAYKRAHP
jgi:hypothetical protein